MGKKKIPLYIYVRRFIDDYDEENHDYGYHIYLMKSYIILLKRIKTSMEEIGAGIIFLEKLPEPLPFHHYEENSMLLIIKEQFYQTPKVSMFFYDNGVDILKKLKNYLDFVRRGEG